MAADMENSPQRLLSPEIKGDMRVFKNLVFPTARFLPAVKSPQAGSYNGSLRLHGSIN